MFVGFIYKLKSKELVKLFKEITKSRKLTVLPLETLNFKFPKKLKINLTNQVKLKKCHQ